MTSTGVKSQKHHFKKIIWNKKHHKKNNGFKIVHDLCHSDDDESLITASMKKSNPNIQP